MTVVWNPTRLNSSIKSVFPKSVLLARVEAKSRLHNKSKSDVKSRVTSSSSALLIGTGLAATFEKGREGGYEINPSGQAGVRRSFSRKTGSVSFKSRAGKGDKFALKFVGGDGRFAAYAVGGDMRPYPAMGPAAQDWARVIYPRTAQAILATAGFSIAQAMRH